MKHVLNCLLCVCLMMCCAVSNAESTEPSSTGNGLMPYDQVLRLIKWVDNGYYRNRTYDEFVAFTGVEGLDKGHRDTSMSALGDHYFQWITDSDKTHFIQVCFRGRDDSGRFEACQWNTSGFNSSEWKQIDLSDWLIATACHDTQKISLDIQRYSNPLVTVSAQLPVVGWNTRVSSNKATLYNDRGENNNNPMIEIVTYDDPAMFDFNLDNYENVQPAPSRVIAGVEMQGRTYHNIGWDWTEYSAQLSEKVSICVRISRINCNAGTEGDGVLNSLGFTWTEADGTVYTYLGSEPVGNQTGEVWYQKIIRILESFANALIPGQNPVTAEVKPSVTEAPVITETPAPTEVPAVSTELVDSGDYPGIWYSTWLHTGGMDCDPRSAFGLTIKLTLNADGTGDFDYLGSDGGGYWAADEDGIVRYWGEGTPLSFMEDGNLCYGSYLSGYILFSRNENAIATVFPQNPTVQQEMPTLQTAVPEITSEPDAGNSKDFVGVKYVGKTYMAGGVSMDASILGGEYSILLNADGTASFTMAGMEVPGYNWKQVGDTIEVDAYGTVLMKLSLNPDGTMLMDYSGAFSLLMEAQK